MTRYRTIVADPPWDYPEGFASVDGRPHKQDRDRGITGGRTIKTRLPYQSMSLDEIRAIPMHDFVARDARLFLWATMRYLVPALGLLAIFEAPRRQASSVVRSRRGRPGPYLEMFARRGRLGWDYWGDESLGTAQLEAENAA